MKAIKYDKYGSYKRIYCTEIEKPQIRDDEILVKVHSASLNQLDVHVLEGSPLFFRIFTGLFRPKNKRLGSDISGTIESIGHSVSEFTVGEEVFGQIFIDQDGGFAEYVLCKSNQIAKKPSNASHNEAASLPIAGVTALQCLRDANVKKGSNVLVQGASGGVGTFVIQIAKALEANVTAICSTRNVEFARKSGADRIIDYKKEKWNYKEKKYDAIINVNGYNKIRKYIRALNDNGSCILVGGRLWQTFEMFLVKPFLRKSSKTLNGFLTKPSRKDLTELSNLLKEKKIQPIIDVEFKLEDTNEAFKHIMEGKTLGKTILKIV